jgi:hypothetical protein
LYQYTENNPVNGTDPLGLFTVSEVPSLVKTGADKLFQKVPLLVFRTALGRLLNGPATVFSFFAFPDTLASPPQEDLRYRDLFPNVYGQPIHTPDRFGLRYDPNSGLYLKTLGTDIRACKEK